MALGLLLPLAACSTTAMVQTKTQDTRQARVYFLRSTVTIGGVADIKVDGQKVASLANNSFFFVDRDPGQYTISVRIRLRLDVSRSGGAAVVVDLLRRGVAGDRSF